MSKIDPTLQANVRYNSGDLSGVPSGYENPDAVTDITVPSCTIEDVDRSVMALFDATIRFTVSTKDGTLNKVPVIFATGERFALLNRNKPIRDKEGKLILPLVSIRRTNVDQSDADMTGRGMNQHTGDHIIKRRLGAADRAYQQIRNKLGLKNQSGTAVYNGEPDPLGTADATGDALSDPDIQAGGMLKDTLGDNVFELITLPQPQFYTARYEIVFWAQYTQQMNEMLEQLMLAQLPQGRTFRLNTDKGYWFVMYVDEGKTSADNFEDFSEKERLIKYSLSANVPAYLIAGGDLGGPVPLRRTHSAPRVRFDIFEPIDGSPTEDPALAAGDPSAAFTLRGEPKRRTDKVSPRIRDAHEGVKRRGRFVRVLQENTKVGETVYSGDPTKKLDVV